MSETPEKIKARLKVYDWVGTLAFLTGMAGLTGVFLCAIWQAPQWAYSITQTLMLLGGVVFVLLVPVHSAAKDLLAEAEARTKQ